MAGTSHWPQASMSAPGGTGICSKHWRFPFSGSLLRNELPIRWNEPCWRPAFWMQRWNRVFMTVASRGCPGRLFPINHATFGKCVRWEKTGRSSPKKCRNLKGSNPVGRAREAPKSVHRSDCFVNCFGRHAPWFVAATRRVPGAMVVKTASPPLQEKRRWKASNEESVTLRARCTADSGVPGPGLSLVLR